MKERITKVTSAAYKVIDFFPENDPLKNRSKDKALAILESSTEEDIDVLLGYFWIAKVQGWLSPINYLIICNEYEKIRRIISKTEVEVIEKSTQIAQEPVLNTSGAIKEKASDSLLLGDRQQKIVEFLGDKEKAQVMDLQKVLPKVTKRTIRRDLDNLLESGKVIRLGEFNQVFYSLKR